MILFTGVGVCSRGGVGDVPAPGGCLVRGVPGQEECLLRRGLVETPHHHGMATAAGSKHPTGMHSC